LGEIRFLDDGEWNQYPRLIPCVGDRLWWAKRHHLRQSVAHRNLGQTLFIDIAGLIAQVERLVILVIKQVLSEEW
jgi:hypothetical protein